MSQQTNPSRSPDPSTENRTPRSDHNQIIWIIWLTYGAFYFCRANISAAVPGLKSPVSEGGLGLDESQIGWILGSWKIAYAVGQLINGQLSESLSSRKMLAIGMLGSAALNVVFGFGTAMFFLLFVWAMNGYCQSLGWTPCVRVMANWIPVQSRGKAIGLVGTGYQLTAALTFVIAGWAVSGLYFEFSGFRVSLPGLGLGWQGAFYAPTGILVAASLAMLFFLKESPPDPAEDQTDKNAPPAQRERRDFFENLWLTISNPSLWLLGIALGLLNACRYGYMDWGLAHLSEVQETGVGKAGLKIAVLPIGAIAGAYLSGWATDRFFGSRRAPVICILLVLLGLMTLAYPAVVRNSVTGTLVMLVAIGFCIYGPQVLLVGTAPADLARRGTSAAAAGFVNAQGYLGAALFGDVLTGTLLKHYGWQTTIFVWAACAFVAAICAAFLWNATAKSSDNKALKESPPEN